MTLTGTMIIWSMQEKVTAQFETLEAHGLGDFRPRNSHRTRLRRAVIAVKDMLREKFENTHGCVDVKCPDHHKLPLESSYELTVPTVVHGTAGLQMDYVSVGIVSVDDRTGELAFRPANAGDSLDSDLVDAIRSEFKVAATCIDAEQIRDVVGRYLTGTHGGCRGVSMQTYGGGAPWFVPSDRASQLVNLTGFVRELATTGGVTCATMPLDGDKAEMAEYVAMVERSATDMIQREIDGLVADLRKIQGGTPTARGIRGKLKEVQEIKEKIANYSTALKAKEAEFVAWADKATSALDCEVDSFEKNRPLTGAEFCELIFGSATAPAPVAPAVSAPVAPEVENVAAPEVENVVAAPAPEVNNPPVEAAPRVSAPLPADFAPAPVVAPVAPAAAPVIAASRPLSRFEKLLAGEEE